MKTLIIYSDPGHAWLKVKITELIKLKIAEKISVYSYQRKEYAYLEEDCDAGLYIETLKSQGIEYRFKTFHTNKSSKIRNYFCYDNTTKGK